MRPPNNSSCGDCLAGSTHKSPGLQGTPAARRPSPRRAASIQAPAEVTI